MRAVVWCQPPDLDRRRYRATWLETREVLVAVWLDWQRKSSDSVLSMVDFERSP